MSDPILADNSFALVMMMDVKNKDQDRMEVYELCGYEVKDGEISEEFFM